KEDGHPDAGLTEGEALLHEGHTQPRGAGVDRCPCHLDRSVSVPVGLHHGHQAGARRRQNPDVVADGVEVDPGSGGTVRGHDTTSLTASGTRSSTSSAVAPSNRSILARSPASPCTNAPADAASSGAR